MKQLLFLAALFAASCAPRPVQSGLTLPNFASFEAQQSAPKFETDLILHVAELSKKYPKRAVQIGYIYSYASVALAVQHEYGIPAELTLAVAGIETGFGQSSICMQSGNHFNIKKGDGWRGLVHTDGRGVQWRKYRNTRESYEDFGAFILARAPHIIASPTPENFAATGYAGRVGRKQYAAALHSIMQVYGLQKLFE